MEKTNTHFTQERKEYSKPVLKKIGLVKDLTKAEKGSSDTDGAGFAEPGPVGG